MQLTGDPRKVKLIYGNRTEQQIACRDELAGQDTIFVLSQPPQNWCGKTGVIDAALIDKVFKADEFSTWVFVLCGPKIMLDVVEDHLVARGVLSSRILSERFEYD